MYSNKHYNTVSRILLRMTAGVVVLIGDHAADSVIASVAAAQNHTVHVVGEITLITNNPNNPNTTLITLIKR